MKTQTLGRVLLTVVLLLTVAAEIAFTWLGWTGAHIFNPLWHPHARFHAVQMSVCISALSLVALRPLWRNPATRLVSTAIVTLHICWWGGEFVATAIPGTSPSPILGQPNTFPLFGIQVYGNLFFAGLMILLSIAGGMLIQRAAPETGGQAARSGAASPQPHSVAAG